MKYTKWSITGRIYLLSIHKPACFIFKIICHVSINFALEFDKVVTWISFWSLYYKLPFGLMVKSILPNIHKKQIPLRYESFTWSMFLYGVHFQKYREFMAMQRKIWTDELPVFRNKWKSRPIKDAESEQVNLESMSTLFWSRPLCLFYSCKQQLWKLSSKENT
jgi:hypothetical protein